MYIKNIINNNMNNETPDLSRFNQIPYRLESIKNMIDGKILDSMIDFKNDEQIGGSNVSDDIRKLLKND